MINSSLPIPYMSLYEIEDKLMEECRSGTYQFSLSDLERLPQENFETLEENPLHIILSHGCFSNASLSAMLSLVKVCPHLLKMADENGETPIDVLYKRNESFGLVLETAYPDFFDRAVCLCYSKYANELIPVELLSAGEFPQSEIDALDPAQNPVLVCRKLGREDLIAVIYKYMRVANTTGDLQCALAWRDVEGVGRFIAINSPMLKCYCSRIYEIGCDEQWIKKTIDREAQSNVTNVSFNSKLFISCFYLVPELIKDYTPNDKDLLYVLNYCLSSKKLNSKRLEINSDLIKKLIENDQFDLKYFNVDHYIPHVIPRIYTVNKKLAEEIIRICVKQGLRESLFVDICYGNCGARAIECQEFFSWIVPLFKKENIPVQLVRSYPSPLFYMFVNYIDREWINKFFEHIEKLIPREEIQNLLRFRDHQNRLPIDYFLEKLDICREPIFLRLFNLSNFYEAHDLKTFIFQVIFYGNEELDRCIPLESFDLESLIKPHEYELEYDKPFFQGFGSGRVDIKRVQKFFTFMKSLPKKMQVFFLSEHNRRTSIQYGYLPFNKESLICENTESNELLKSLNDLGVSFGFSLLSFIKAYLIKDFEIFREILAYEGPCHTEVKKEFNIKCIENQRPELVEILLDYYADGSLIAYSEEIKSFYDYLLNKLGSNYRGYALEFQDKGAALKISRQGLQIVLEGYHTQQAIDRAIEKDLNFLKLSDTEALKLSELKEYSDILFHEGAETNSKFCIINNVTEQRFDFFFMGPVKRFHYARPDLLNKLKKYVKTQIEEFEKGELLLKEEFPDYQFRAFRSGFRVKTNEFHFVFQGVPSIQQVRKVIEKKKESMAGLKEAETLGFQSKSLPATPFSETIQSLTEEKLLGVWEVGKLLIIKNPKNLSMLFFTDIKNVKTGIQIIEASQDLKINYDLAKSIQFKERDVLIHDCNADIDLNMLNNPTLSNFITFCKKGKIKELSEEDSRRVTIQLTHTVKKLLSDKQELARFARDLAHDATLCGWRISERVAYEYKSAFQLFQSDCVCERTLDSLLNDLYRIALLETIQTMTKLVQHPLSRNQTIHIGSYLRKQLKNAISLPFDPLHGNMLDHCVSGEDDYPLGTVLSYYEAFFIPILIERLIALQKEDFEAHKLLMEALIEVIPTPAGMFDALTMKRDQDLSDCEERLKIANNKLNELLVDPGYLQNEQIRRERDEIKNKIAALSSAWNTLNNKEPTLHKKNVAVSDQHRLKIETERIQHQQAKINQAISELKEKKRALTKSPIDSTQKEIKNLKIEKESIWELYHFKKKTEIEEFCEKEGYLAYDALLVPYITPKGAAKLLELKSFICPYSS